MKGSDVPTVILMHWYMCGRKVPFGTEQEARDARPWRTIFYQCEHGNHWHTATQSPGPVQTNAIYHSRRRNAQKKWDEYAYATPQDAP